LHRRVSLVRTIVLLSVSNIFMTFAWYGHLTFRQAPLYLVILVSWGIVSFEYCFQVPANRFGYSFFTNCVRYVIPPDRRR